MKNWEDKLIKLVEKECHLYDTRPKKDRGDHPSGNCYMNKILDLVEKLLEENKKIKGVYGHR